MLTSPRRPAHAAALIALAAWLIVAAPVVAKLGMEANLDAPISRDAIAGTRMTVGWSVAQVAGVDRLPFESPGPVFLRLYPMTRGAAPTEVLGVRDPDDPSHFRAEIVTPAGGVARVEIGLRNESCVAGICTQDDMLIVLTGDVLVAGPGVGAPIGVVPAVGVAESASLAGPIALISAIVVAASVATMAALDRGWIHRRRPDTGPV